MFRKGICEELLPTFNSSKYVPLEPTGQSLKFGKLPTEVLAGADFITGVALMFADSFGENFLNKWKLLIIRCTN